MCACAAEGALEYIQVELDMFRMTALFIVERNKAHLLAEIFKLLKLSAQASRHLSSQPEGSPRQGFPKSPSQGQKAGEEPDLAGSNPLLRRRRGPAVLAHQVSSGGLSDDDGNLNDASLMSRSALPAQQESSMRYV